MPGLFLGLSVSAGQGPRTPNLVSISPATGLAMGGTPMTLSGGRFTGATGVTVGGTACTSVVVVSDSSVTCVAPLKAAGVYDVAITTPNGTSTLAAAYTADVTEGVAAIVGANPTALWIPGIYATDRVGGDAAVSAVKDRMQGTTYQWVAGAAAPWSATGWDATHGALVCNGTSHYYTCDALAPLYAGTTMPPWWTVTAFICPSLASLRSLWTLWNSAQALYYHETLLGYTSLTKIIEYNSVATAEGVFTWDARVIYGACASANKISMKMLIAAGETVIVNEAAFNPDVKFEGLNRLTLFARKTPNAFAPVSIRARAEGNFAITPTQLSAAMVHFRDTLDCPLA